MFGNQSDIELGAQIGCGVESNIGTCVCGEGFDEHRAIDGERNDLGDHR